MDVKFLDLITPHTAIENELIETFRSALRSGIFVGGPEVEKFEREFANYCGTGHCVTVGSGTDAVRFALLAAGIGKGDLVLTVANTFIATTEAITQAGADFDFVDIDERTYTIDPERLRLYLEGPAGRRVKAVVPVHLYGQMCDMDAILSLAKEYGLIVIEDACQAHGARYYSRMNSRWFRAGTMGDAAAFSFYPGKNLGACGEGGAITTNSPEIAARARMLRDHGQARKYYHDIEGYNGRLDSIQCGILRVKLRGLDVSNDKRRKAALRYAQLLGGIPEIVIPFEPDWSKGVYHLYVIRAESRDELQKYLNDRKIGTGLHYPIPLHLQKCYSGRDWSDDLDVTGMVSDSILSLPIFPHISPAQLKQVASCIRSFYSERPYIGNEMSRSSVDEKIAG